MNTSATETIFLIRLELDQRLLFRFAAARKLQTRTLDDGYAIHCLLNEAFGEIAPKPFSFGQDRNGLVEVLGYGGATASMLVNRLDEHGAPDVQRVVASTRIASKPMPDVWQEGKRLAFETRALPTKRLGKSASLASEGEVVKFRQGAEVDAFLSACMVAGDEPVDREAVYTTWLAKELGRYSAACLVAANIEGTRRIRLARRNHAPNRKARAIERSEVLFRGILEINDAEAFSRLLARGLGRHRAFGFGMLLVKKA